MLTDEVKEKRKNYITSTEVAALFGVSKYKTPFQLYHEKLGDLEETYESNERAEMGLAFERVIAELACKKLGYRRPVDKLEFIACDKIRMGASFDFEAISDTHKSEIIECKNVDALVFRNEWVVEGDEIIECPLHIELQLQHQMAVSTYSVIVLAVLVGGNKLYTKIVEADKRVQDAIVEKVRDFWAQESAPEPDYEVDWPTINRLYTTVETDGEIEADEELESLARQYDNQSKIKSVAEKEQRAIKAKIQERVGNAAKVFGEGIKISRTAIKPATVSYERKGYVAMRITVKKDKE